MDLFYCVSGMGPSGAVVVFLKRVPCLKMTKGFYFKFYLKRLNDLWSLVVEKKPRFLNFVVIQILFQAGNGNL